MQDLTTLEDLIESSIKLTDAMKRQYEKAREARQRYLEKRKQTEETSSSSEDGEEEMPSAPVGKKQAPKNTQQMKKRGRSTTEMSSAACEIIKSTENRIHITAKINGIPETFLVNGGADVSILNMHTYRKHKQFGTVLSDNVLLRGVNGESPTRAHISIPLTVGKFCMEHPLVVSDKIGYNTLGADLLQILHVIVRTYLAYG